jgi:hypothetical protein
MEANIYFFGSNVTNSFEAYIVRIAKIISLLYMDDGNKSRYCWKQQYDHWKQYHAALETENIRKKLLRLYK